jgi:integrase
LNSPFSAPKIRFAKHSIALGSNHINVLRAHYERQNSKRLAAGEKWYEHGMLLPTSLCISIQPRYLLRDFKKLLRDAGLPTARFHDLRHTASSLMLNNNIPHIVASRHLVQAIASITLNFSGHLIPEVAQYLSLEILVKLPNIYMAGLSQG